MQHISCFLGSFTKSNMTAWTQSLAEVQLDSHRDAAKQAADIIMVSTNFSVLQKLWTWSKQQRKENSISQLFTFLLTKSYFNPKLSYSSYRYLSRCSNHTRLTLIACCLGSRSTSGCQWMTFIQGLTWNWSDGVASYFLLDHLEGIHQSNKRRCCHAFWAKVSESITSSRVSPMKTCSVVKQTNFTSTQSLHLLCASVFLKAQSNFCVARTWIQKTDWILCAFLCPLLVQG